MRLLWQGPSRQLACWWALLTLAGSTNIVLWLLLYRHSRPTEGAAWPVDVSVMLLLCAVYVFGCAFRSFLPRADVQRYCLFDTWLSSVVVGRSVATVAEVCFAAQWAMMLHRLGEVAGSEAVMAVALLLIPMIIIAQCCSWYGVLTTNCLANAIENAIWAVAFFLVALALLRLLPEYFGMVRLLIVVGVIGIAAYLAFLVITDIPMYLERWRTDVAAGRGALNSARGVARCDHPSDRHARPHALAR